MVGADGYFYRRRVQLTTLAARLGVPTVFTTREFAEAGGLMSYGTSLPEAFRMTGLYAGRILKGARPADLPVVQSSKFGLVINAETASRSMARRWSVPATARGAWLSARIKLNGCLKPINCPPSLIGRADRQPA